MTRAIENRLPRDFFTSKQAKDAYYDVYNYAWDHARSQHEVDITKLHNHAFKYVAHCFMKTIGGGLVVDACKRNMPMSQSDYQILRPNETDAFYARKFELQNGQYHVEPYNRLQLPFMRPDMLVRNRSREKFVGLVFCMQSFNSQRLEKLAALQHEIDIRADIWPEFASPQLIVVTPPDIWKDTRSKLNNLFKGDERRMYTLRLPITRDELRKLRDTFYKQYRPNEYRDTLEGFYQWLSHLHGVSDLPQTGNG